MSVTAEALSQQADVRLDAAPAEVMPGVWTTGEIKDRQAPQGRSAHHFIQVDGDWRPDPYRDDISLVVETRAGLVLVCGCCHAGLLNTLSCVKRTFARPITTIIGGTHLVDASAAQLDHVVASLRDAYDGPRLYPNHCTGQRAYVALFNAFADAVQPFPAGARMTFD
jgi:7,8-dihydropterin-6-yl-methyl-4-(beta-D-ribofuranosyl)aminobenzene 5'-phosphate synthase